MNRPLDPAYIALRSDLQRWAIDNRNRLIETFLASGLPRWQFALWLRKRRIEEEGA